MSNTIKDSIDRASDTGARYGWIEGLEAAIRILTDEVKAGRNAEVLLPLIQRIVQLPNPHAEPESSQ